MSIPQPPQPAKLVVGCFMQAQRRFAAVIEDLIAEFGEVDLISPWFKFDHTDYYSPEMGAPLFRRVTAFKDLIQQEDLPEIKLRTNAIEKKYVQDARRTVNIDPGYLLRERFVLATGKNFSHRIYIGKGIYADLTLVFYKDEFRTLDWTYPDYADKKMRAFLKRLRTKAIADFKRGEPQP